MIWRKVAALFRKRHLDAELDEEIRFHVAAQVEENIRSGMPAEEARRAALRDFGGVEQVKEAHRDSRGIRWLAEAVQDGRFAVRMLGRSPGFTAVALLTLALGIGANTAIFSVIHAVMLKPLPYPEPGELVRVWVTRPPLPGSDGGPRRGAWVEREWAERLRERNRSFDEVACYRAWMFNLTGGGAPERLFTVLVSDGFFGVLGVGPALGRAFAPEEMVEGNDQVAILSDGFWRSRFEGDPEVLGKTIMLDGAASTIVGVMPAGFRPVLPSVRENPAVYLPTSRARFRGRPYTTVWSVARLRPGVAVEAARQETAAILETVSGESGQELTGVELVPVRDEIGEQLRGALLVLFGASLCVLAIVCANLGTLVFARSLARGKELAVRAALGAGRGRLAKQMFTESVALGVLGGVAGLALHVWLVKLIVRLYPGSLPRAEVLGPDPAVFGFGLLLAVATGALVGLIPAWRLSRCDLSAAVKEGAPGDGVRGGRWRDVLVGAEVALAIVLVSGAGLLLRSFLLLQEVDPAFRQERLTFVSLVLPEYDYGERDQQAAFADRLVERVQRVPGVLAAGVTNSPPLVARATLRSTLEVAGGESGPAVFIRAVTAGYLEALGVRLVTGRLIEPADAARNDAMLLNRTAARSYFGEEDPIGRRVKFVEGEFTVVGVVADIKNVALERETDGEVYVPFGAVAGGFLTLAVHSVSDLDNLAAALRAEVRAADPNLPVSQLLTADRILSDELAPPRFRTTLLGAFAGLALLLASLGIYGVIAHGVARRTREIGVRMALGARPGDVVRLVVSGGLVAPVIGVIAGTGGALAVTPVLGSFLYGVEPSDPTTFGATAVVLLVVALAAAAIPARRAAGVDPMQALRAE